jgi:iron(III) transport system substrate-binding protein
VANHAPHPNAALLFYDYMLSSDAQNILSSMNYVPTNTKIASPLRSLRTKLVDPAIALDQGEKWSKSYEDVVKKSSR